ncbi:MAG: nicotinate-nucleotide adenylyltransferase [Vulcanimicrobiota bacterium]
MKQKIGIMGGTFNPVHIGHLIVAQEAWERFGLDKILFIPNSKPPHKQGADYRTYILDPELRYIMTYLAISNNPHFFASRIELDRPGLSYTLETIKELKKLYKDAEISFITGVDSLLNANWSRLDQLLGLLENFIAATRPGLNENDLENKKKELNLTREDKIRVLKIPGIAISSTMIRKRIREGRTIKYMVPAEVETFIKKKHLYI